MAITEARAYEAGWAACMSGIDGRFCPHERGTELAYAWNQGFLDAMEAEEDEQPLPETAGYTE